MRFETLEIEPQKNPAVLDTATWEPASAWRSLSAVDESYFASVSQAIREKTPLPLDKGCAVYTGSCAEHREKAFCLARFADGQYVFLEIGADGEGGPLEDPIGIRSLSNGAHMAAYRADASTIDRYVRMIRPDKGPKVLGAVRRLGIGARMSTACWPGVWRAMHRYGFQANPIQNSVREVNLLDDLLAGRPARLNYLPNFGRVEEGHTGSTFEGLWVAGVLEALKADCSTEYGADADHITVRRGPDELAHAKRVIETARLYTFFTLDISDLLDYDAPKGSAARKYHPALDVVGQLADHITAIKNGIPFDLELSIDETPSGVDAFGCLTSEAELTFLFHEFHRRQIPITHVAPNFGIEKGLDYRGADGLNGLEERVGQLCRCAREFGVMLDCHSGDDLKPETRRAVGRAAKGDIHFKVSPVLQVILAEVLNEFDPGLFRFWWDDTLDYARREAEAGSTFAAHCLREYETSGDGTLSPSHAVFHYYGFATVGRRDEEGQFIHRQRFYDLPENFYTHYQDRVTLYLGEVAADVFDSKS
jgi:hypothetical protein